MSVALRNHLSKGSGTTRRNDCYTKCGGFDKLNHRNANLLDSPFFWINSNLTSSNAVIRRYVFLTNNRLLRIFSHILVNFLFVLKLNQVLQLFLLHHLWPCAGRFFCTEPQMYAYVHLKFFTEIFWPWLSRMCRSDIRFCLKLNKPCIRTLRIPWAKPLTN